jgi:Holliday junction resolvasome RuvABC ATP-dependent DNA helicase subunit
MLKRVRDYAQVRADGVITKEVADAALQMLEVDALGLDEFDRRFLRAIIEKFEASHTSCSWALSTAPIGAVSPPAPRTTI